VPRIVVVAPQAVQEGAAAQHALVASEVPRDEMEAEAQGGLSCAKLGNENGNLTWQEHS